MGEMITPQDVADRLRLTVYRVHQLIRAGKLPATSFGRFYLVNEDDLALVANRPTGRPKKAETAEKVSGVPVEYPLEAAEHMKEIKPKTKATKKRATKKVRK
jgi:excisionase family DNA binding protein